MPLCQGLPPGESQPQRITVPPAPWQKAVLFIIALAFLIITGSACSLMRPVPIQLTRVSQSESYTQVFTFPGLNNQAGLAGETMSDHSNAKQIQHVDRILSQLLGGQNWQNIKDLYGFGTLYDELVQGKIYVKGMVELILYIDPLEQDHFFIEGMGRFYLVQDKTKAILLSGDFHIPLVKHRLDELDAGRLLVDVKLYVTRIPEQITYLNEARLIYELIMDTHMKEDHIYAVDYEKEHTVYLITDRLRAAPLPTDAIGVMRLENDSRAAKLIDLRGMQFLRNDYSRHFK